MKKLPTEMIVEIASHLPFADKLSLACACKKLHDTTSENTLYSKLVFKDKLKLDQAMDFDGKSKLGRQVRYLCVANMDYDTALNGTSNTISSRSHSGVKKWGC